MEGEVQPAPCLERSRPSPPCGRSPQPGRSCREVVAVKVRRLALIHRSDPAARRCAPECREGALWEARNFSCPPFRSPLPGIKC